MSLETLLATPHTHGLITLVAMDDPTRSGLVAINQGFKQTCDVPKEILKGVEQLYLGFKVTGMDHYGQPLEKLQEGMSRMVELHVRNVLWVYQPHFEMFREIAAVVWNNRPHKERNDLGLDDPDYALFTK